MILYLLVILTITMTYLIKQEIHIGGRDSSVAWDYFFSSIFAVFIVTAIYLVGKLL